ncbi:MAG: hypothetical protein U0414_06675 [Polyangiaceae bacterium]
MIFELESLGGPFGKRLGKRRAPFDRLDWSEPVDAPADALAAARVVWTQTAFSEYASAAAFAEIAAALLAASAPLDLVAAAGEFILEESVHCEVSARLAMRAGGAVPLEVDLRKLVRPPRSSEPILRAAELLVRTSCVGEALTLPLLKTSQRACTSPLVSEALGLIAADESAHAELGPWFLDWARDRISDEDRAELGRSAGEAIRAFCPLFGQPCSKDAARLGVPTCSAYDAAFLDALDRRVIAPLAARDISIPSSAIAELRRAAGAELQ